MIGSSLKRAVGANPFVGPRPFETGRKIFGRDREIDDLYYLLSAERIVLLHSPSGAGKSSLVQAGLIPRLNERFVYSITRSARSSIAFGIVRPIALAALRLITSSYLVGCCTGRSAGLAPFRILST